jgi:dienelactone hydrolase
MKHLLLLPALLAATAAQAAVKLETIEYQQDGATLEGYAAYDDALKGKRPGVLIVHQWRGAGDYEKKRAEMLAKLGYIAFALDIYGKGVRPATVPEAAALSGKFKNDRALLRARARAGLEQLKKHPLADPKRVAAIGYCFGGTTALEMARAGMDVAGVVSFHGGLNTQPGMEATTVKAKLRVLHGADDPFVPPAEVEAFKAEMKRARADLRFTAYPGAVHSFTDWDADGSIKGAQYNREADEKSWEAMKGFFRELFGK